MLVQATSVQITSVQTRSVQMTETLGGTETILLVEDEAFVREVTCEVLQSAGYRVLTARNASEAASVYDGRRDEIELLLTDVVLPGETGRALAGRLRRENPQLQVLLVTGYGAQMGLLETEHEEKDGTRREECLAKPFSSEILLQRVRQLLDRRTVLARTNLPIRTNLMIRTIEDQDKINIDKPMIAQSIIETNR